MTISLQYFKFAIVFRTPAYKKPDIKKPVDVELMLYRPSTGTYSKALPFRYHPDQTGERHIIRGYTIYHISGQIYKPCDMILTIYSLHI